MGFLNGEPLESEGTFVSRFCVQLIIILVLPRIIHGLLLKRLLQPRVISEIISGIILGPSCLGQIHGFTDNLFPARSIPFLQALGTVGVILFLFMTGCHLKPHQLWAYKWKALFCSFFAMGLTFAVAPGVAILFESKKYTDFDYTLLVILIAILLSIPAEAVMARILAERGLLGSELGSFSMATDGIGLLSSFILLAAILSLHSAENPWKPPTNICSGAVLINPDDSASTLDPLWICLIFIGFVILLLTVFRVLFTWMAIRVADKGRTDGTIFVFAIVLNYVSAWFTQTLTISDLIGPICLGLFSVPRAGPLAQNLETALGPVTVGLFLPVFFALVGLKTDFTLLNGDDVGLAFVLLGALWGSAFVGAFSMATLLSRGFSFQNFYFATLRTCKGLTALTILNILFSVQVITPLFYSLVVLYAIVSCAIVSPLIFFVQFFEERLMRRRLMKYEDKVDMAMPKHIMVAPQVGYLAPVTTTVAAWIATHEKDSRTKVLFVRFIDDLDNLEEFIPLLQDPIPAGLLASDHVLGTCQVRWKGLRPIGTAHYKAVVAPSVRAAFLRLALGKQKEKIEPYRHLVIGYEHTSESEQLLIAALKAPNARIFAVTGQPSITLAGAASALVIVTGDGSEVQCLHYMFQEQSATVNLVYWRLNDPAKRPEEIANCQTVLSVFATVAALENTPKTFEAIFCPIPHSKKKFLNLLNAASRCHIPVVFESDPGAALPFDPDVDHDDDDDDDDSDQDENEDGNIEPPQIVLEPVREHHEEEEKEEGQPDEDE